MTAAPGVFRKKFRKWHWKTLHPKTSELLATSWTSTNEIAGLAPTDQSQARKPNQTITLLIPIVKYQCIHEYYLTK